MLIANEIPEATMKKETDFDAIKREFQSCYSPKLIDKLILKDLAERHQVTEKTVNELALFENWSAMRDESSKKIHDLQDLEEKEVRAKNFKAGTAILDKGWQKLSQTNPGDITVGEAIKMAQLGLKARHEAAGIPTNYDAFQHNNLYLIPGEETIEEGRIRQQYYKQLADKLVASTIRAKSEEQEAEK